MQLRVAVAGIIVAEQACNKAAFDVDLGDPVRAGAGGDSLTLEVLHRVGNSDSLRSLNRLTGGLVAQTPEHRHALRGGEDKVESGDGLLRRPSRRGDESA